MFKETMTIFFNNSSGVYHMHLLYNMVLLFAHDFKLS